jgi:Iap family predicted aminopeptidase
MTPPSPPVNVIFLENSKHKPKEEVISEYIDILVTCKKADEFYQCLSMLYDDAIENIAEKIILQQIQSNIEILEKLRK